MRHGIVTGLVLALFRVFRCTGGLFEGGDDPVPAEPSLHYLFGSYRRFWRWNRRQSV
jgi:putative component of membrane protein insertase Oxa1/YidC/SpoIIIJ protein YidD